MFHALPSSRQEGQVSVEEGLTGYSFLPTGSHLSLQGGESATGNHSVGCNIGLDG